MGARLGAAAKYWSQGGVLIEMYTKYKIFNVLQFLISKVCRFETVKVTFNSVLN